ncbi:histidine phosphatase family protein [Treponema zioleckii]|uniref:histidine phosphatase family protein n=1 Tax=Treponema zioleckii TaxID=331680 RepID=UPI00168BA1CC|nr:histidine phosphatase family protein [Treponema zioleckii]
MRIYITRHGETDWNKAWKLQGRTDIPLNAHGIEQARRTGEGLKKAGIIFDRVYSSPLQRACKTAELISGFSADKIIKDSRIIEFSFGKAEGTTPEERKLIPELKDFGNFFEAPQNYKAQPDAESFETVFARTADFWENEIKNLPAPVENVLVTTHGGTLQSLLLHVDGRPLADYWKVRFPNCSMNLVELKDDKFRLVWTSRLFC